MERKTKRTFHSEEERDAYLINLAKQQALEQLENGTASSQVLTHYLKIGSIKDQIELEILQSQNKLISAKTESILAAQRMDSIVENALKAFRRYAGKEPEEDDD